MQRIISLSALLAVVLLGAGCSESWQAVVLDVPFTSQAPAGNWSEPWANACEETSLYMVNSFYTNDDITREEAVKEISEIFDKKHSVLPVSADESIETMIELARILDVSWEGRRVVNPTIEDMQHELRAGRPIIVPVYAPDLEQDYPLEGFDYHVVVLIGYDDVEGVFIVNDPGTEQGEAMRLPYATFMNAIHDLNIENYQAGDKAVLFTQPK